MGKTDDQLLEDLTAGGGFDPFAPQRSRKVRTLLWTVRRTIQLHKWVVKRGWRYRRVMAPVYAAMFTFILAAVCSLLPEGGTATAVFFAAGSVPVWRRLGGWLGPLTRRRDLGPWEHRIWYAAFYAALAMWAVVAASWTPGPPMPGFLLVITVPVFIRWCWHHRIRPTKEDQGGEREAAWESIKGLDDTSITNIDEAVNPTRWTADVDLSDSNLHVPDVMKLVPKIAKKYRVPASNIIVDWGPGRLEDLVKLTVMQTNLCDDPVVFDESWIPTAQDVEDGCVPYHSYGTGQRGRVRLWHAGAGGVNFLFSGDPRVGKSEGMQTLGIQGMFTGRVWLVAGDPQNGMSFPALCGPNARGAAQWQATEDDGIYNQLRGLLDGMDARSRALAEFKYADKWGDTHVGLNCWSYALTGWPLVLVLFDEFWKMMLNPDFAPLCKELLKKMGKVGYAMAVATQYPGLPEFGDDAALRQPITSGNLLSFRNTDGTTDSMILQKHMPSPFDIPTETVNGGHTKGMLIADSQAPFSSLPVYSRVVWPERSRYWANMAAQRVPDLESYSWDAFTPWMPGGWKAQERLEAAAVRPAEPEQAARESVTVQPPRATAAERITVYLAASASGWQHTGVIAKDLGLPMSTVSQTLSRHEPDRFTQARDGEGNVRRGVWQLATHQENKQLIESAA